MLISLLERLLRAPFRSALAARVLESLQQLAFGKLIICGAFNELQLSYSRGTRSALSDVYSTPLQRVVVAADACRRRPLPSQHCLRRTTAWQCRLVGRALILEMVESIWCVSVVPTIDRATSAWRSSRRVRQHSLRCIAAHRCCLVGRSQLSHNVDSYEARCAVSTIDVAARARWCRRRVRQGCL
jgi:hypothetical protein